MTETIRKAISSILRLIFKLLSTTEVHGLENIPSQGGCILVMNHLSRIDPALVYIVIDKHHRLDDHKMTALVADKYRRIPGISWLVNIFAGIWINREEADFQAIRSARDFMKEGGMLGIAPEGTRSHTGALIPGKTGAAFLANAVGVPLVPIAVTGTEKAFHELARFRRPHITMEFGQPFRLPALDRKDRSASLRRNTDEIMCRIALMLPPEYHGVYAGHPKLQELQGT
jgi:1-acyl-sn-glycerol-3-phosphate acyltransferase